MEKNFLKKWSVALYVLFFLFIELWERKDKKEAVMATAVLFGTIAAPILQAPIGGIFLIAVAAITTLEVIYDHFFDGWINFFYILIAFAGIVEGAVCIIFPQIALWGKIIIAFGGCSLIGGSFIFLLHETT